jgi:hypothetical protein
VLHLEWLQALPPLVTQSLLLELHSAVSSGTVVCVIQQQLQFVMELCVKNLRLCVQKSWRLILAVLLRVAMQQQL